MNDLITDKYNIYRPQIHNGDIILIRGNSLLARLINYGDRKNGVNAYWNHALVVLSDQGRLIAIESEAHGVRPDFLSQVISGSLDFTILRPLVCDQAKIDQCVNVAFADGEAGIPYNYGMLPKVLIYRKFGWSIKGLGDNLHRDICSVYAGWTYGGLLPIGCWSRGVINQEFLTPQDMIRFIDKYQVQQLAPEKLD
jgi:hypothetical protein